MNNKEDKTRILLNKKAFTGKLHNAVVDAIINKYKEIYPDKTTKIEYYSEKEARYYHVILESFPFIRNGKIENVKVELGKYTNLEAIEFTDIPEEEFQKKFNDNSYENYKWLEDQLNSLAVMARLRGYHMEEPSVKEHGYRIEIAMPHNTHKYDWLDGRFEVTPITKATAKRIYDKANSAIERFISKNPL